MKDRDQYIQDRIEELADLGLSAREGKHVAEAEYERKNSSRMRKDQEVDKLYEDLLLEQQEQM